MDKQSILTLESNSAKSIRKQTPCLKTAILNGIRKSTFLFIFLPSSITSSLELSTSILFKINKYSAATISISIDSSTNQKTQINRLYLTSALYSGSICMVLRTKETSRTLKETISCTLMVLPIS